MHNKTSYVTWIRQWTDDNGNLWYWSHSQNWNRDIRTARHYAKEPKSYDNPHNKVLKVEITIEALND